MLCADGRWLIALPSIGEQWERGVGGSWRSTSSGQQVFLLQNGVGQKEGFESPKISVFGEVIVEVI